MRAPIDLAASSRDSLHGDYEKSSILAIEYDLDATLQEDVLVDDFKYVLALYSGLITNPLLPNIEQLLEVISSFLRPQKNRL